MVSALMLGVISTSAMAADADTDADTIAWKFTASSYRSSDSNNAIDLNLRGNLGPHTAWVGFYRDDNAARQARAGYERHADIPMLRTVLSAQIASRGFFGGSITSEVGGDNYLLVGWGRTNLRDYFNLNFDPNDAITIGVGTHAIADTDLSLFQVRDDRLHTGQRVTHAVLRRSFAEKQRITIDLSSKRGLDSDGVFVSGSSWSLTCDRGAYFARIARDPYASFTPATQTRLSAGMRF
jgi:hypothetical protein